MKNPVNRLRSLARDFKNIGSVASTQKQLFEIADALDDAAAGDEETQELLEQATAALEDELKVKLALQNENEKLRGELKKLKEKSKG